MINPPPKGGVFFSSTKEYMDKDKSPVDVLADRLQGILSVTVSKVLPTTVLHAEELVVKVENSVLNEFRADAVASRLSENEYEIRVRLFCSCRFTPNIPCPQCILGSGKCQMIYSADESIKLTSEEMPEAWRLEVGVKDDELVVWEWSAPPRRWHPPIDKYQNRFN